ncbi:MAG: hypothetical protein AAF581_01285 [Planctomycetota bacterium]
MLRAMTLFSLLIGLWLVATVADAQEGDSPRIVVPAAKGKLKVDGALDDKEWKGAKEQSLGGGATLLLRHDKKGLGLGVRSENAGILSVFLAIENRVLVLHSSARLGTAIYEKDPKSDAWQPVQKFKYQAPSDEFWKAEGWRANVMKMGAARGDMECLIAPALLRGESFGAKSKKKGKKSKSKGKKRRKGKKESAEIRICVVQAAFTGGRSPSWPKVADGTNDMKLLMGHSPGGLKFDPTQWGVLELGTKRKK